MTDRTVDAGLDLLDRQVVDSRGRMVAKVDDLELAHVRDHEGRDRLAVSAILTGPGALGPRLGGALGTIMTASWARLVGRDPGNPKRIDRRLVAEAGTTIKLRVRRVELDVDGFEVWTRERIIGALPGAGPDPARSETPGPDEVADAGEPRGERHWFGDLHRMRIEYADGTPGQRIMDATLEPLDAGDPDSMLAISQLMVSRVQGMLFGYHRHPEMGPWLIRTLVLLLHRDIRVIGWDDVDLVDWDRGVVLLRVGPRDR